MQPHANFTCKLEKECLSTFLTAASLRRLFDKNLRYGTNNYGTCLRGSASELLIKILVNNMHRKHLSVTGGFITISLLKFSSHESQESYFDWFRWHAHYVVLTFSIFSCCCECIHSSYHWICHRTDNTGNWYVCIAGK